LAAASAGPVRDGLPGELVEERAAAGTAPGAVYGQLLALLAALDGTKPVAGRHGFRFADPVTGKELWLCDIH
jgi:hypothetical protein